MRTYLRLFRFALPYKWRFAGALLSMTVFAATSSLYIVLLGPMLNFLFTGGKGATAEQLSRLLPRWLNIDNFLARADSHRLLVVLPFLIFAVALLKGIAFFGQSFLMAAVSSGMVADLRCALFDRMVMLSPAFHSTHHSGDLISRFNQDVAMVQMAVTDAISSYLRDGITVLWMLVTCFVLDWRMSLMAFCAIPATLFPVIRMAKRLRKTTGQSAASLGKISEIALETLSGIRVVQAFGMEPYEKSRFKSAIRALRRVELGIAKLRAFSSPLMEVMAAAGIGFTIWWVGGEILAGRLEAAKLLSFVAAVLMLYQPVKSLGRGGQMVMMGAASGERVFYILDSTASVPDEGKHVLAPLREAIRFEDVRFSYGDRPQVLKDVNITLRRGQVVAVVGQSGGGKTTLSNLLPRFWDVKTGRITIDGHDIRDCTLESLRKQIAMVTQETVLFNDTIRANIAYGRPDIPKESVERAARQAQAHEFILALPQGYDTVVGERGVLLSGGQRQRIAIARAFLKDAPVLVLDEATSALDSEAEREVQRALDALMNLEGEHRTTLVIAHRLSTIRHADQIVVLVRGRVVETGQHEELLARGGEYAKLWRSFEGVDRPQAPAAMMG